jgi:hypothetical protein
MDYKTDMDYLRNLLLLYRFNHWGDDSQAGSDPECKLRKIYVQNKIFNILFSLFLVFRDTLEDIFSTYNGSVNFYMFHGVYLF